jgi:hypothetical protein
VEAELPPDPAAPPVPNATSGSGATPAPEVSQAPAESSPAVAAAPIVAPLPASEPSYRDRSTGLIVFGIVQIGMGLLAALMIPLIGLSAFMSRLAPRGGAMRPGQIVLAISTYGFIAAALVTLGVGSAQMKRWARALTLVSSWYGMIVGVLITVLLTAVLPVTMRTALRAQQSTGAPASAPPFGIIAVIITVIIVFCAVFTVAVPIAFVVFYSRRDVEQTCRHHDPVERWTDRAPLPVLAASIVLGVGAAYLAVVGVTVPMFPFFGRYFTGLAGSAGMLAMAALDVYLAIALFRRNAIAWWIAVVTLALRLVSMFVTYGWADVMQAYSKLGWSDSELQQLNSNPIIRSHVILWWSLISMLGFFGYLLWLKRYFRTPMPPLGSEPLPAQANG